MGIRLKDITAFTSDLLAAGNTLLTNTSGSLTRLVRWDTLADWILKTYEGFTQSGSGTISRNLQDKQREIVSITDFKNDDNTAVSTSVSDNSTGLQKAADDGRALYIPDGTFTYATGIQFPRSASTMMYGCGAFRSVLKYTGSGKAVGWKTDIINTVSFTHLQGFQIDCSYSTATHGLELSNASNGNGHRWSTYKDLYIVGASEASSVGFRGLAARYCTLENVVCREWDTPFDFEESNNIPCSNITAVCCLANNGISYGFRVRANCIGFTLLRCAVEGDSTYGFHFVGPTSTKPDSHTLQDCWTEDDHSVADYYFENLRAIKVVGCTVGTNTTGDGLKLVNVRQSQFTDLRMEEYAGSGKYAIVADSSSVWNEFQGFIRDSRNLDAVSIASVRNSQQFNFTSNATSPKTLLNTAQKIYSNTGATIDTRENGVYLVDTSGGNITLPATSVSTQNQGVVHFIKKATADANTVQFDPASTQTVDGASNFILRYPNESITVVADGSIPGWRVLAHHVPPTPPVVNTTAVGNVGSGTDVLMTSNIAAGTLLAAGDGIKVTQRGTIANNANPKTLESQFGGQDLFTDKALTVSVASTWLVEYELYSTGTDSQIYWGKLEYEAPAGTFVTERFSGTLAVDDGATIAVRCRGTVTDGGGGINNDDIKQTLQTIEFVRRSR